MGRWEAQGGGGGHFPVWMHWCPGPQGLPDSRARCCPLQAAQERCSPRSVRRWGAVTPMHRQHFQGGRQERGGGKRVQERGGAWEDGGG